MLPLVNKTLECLELNRILFSSYGKVNGKITLTEVFRVYVICPITCLYCATISETDLGGGWGYVLLNLSGINQCP